MPADASNCPQSNYSGRSSSAILIVRVLTNGREQKRFLQMTDVNSLTARAGPERLAPPVSPERFLSIRDVLGRLSISRSLLYELIKDPVRPFPSPVHIGRRSVWIEREVEAFMQDVVKTERKPPRN
jgi:predicted DNA-binding transcriptional regulator AlpA